MRVPVALAALAISVPVLAAGPGSDQKARVPGAASAPNCPQTTSYLAEKSGAYRGGPLTPKKLTELPSATAYMAVYRKIDGCEAPLTMVDYRNPRRR
jgi:hypothetical protein